MSSSAITMQILAAMNDGQKQAITAPLGPVLVVAGPGSGKTRVLTHRIAYLLQEYHVLAGRIMAVTFTNKAAREMRERVEKLLGQSARHTTLGTFHSICARLLRREAEFSGFTSEFAIYDTQDQISLMKKIVDAHNLDPKKYQPGSILDRISSAKNELIGPDDFPVQNQRDQTVQRLYVSYMRALRANNAMDFDDLLMNAVLLFRNHPDVLERYQRWNAYLLVDEFQDTNMAQYEFIKLLGGESRNVFVVGDPDQSIYRFRGADYRNVGLFRREFQPLEVFLTENYRSHQYVLDAAMAVIRKNSDHIRRDLYSQRKKGAKLVIHEAYDDREEADFVVSAIQKLLNEGKHSPEDIAVMFRINAQSRTLEEAFVHAGLPYLTVGTTRFYGRKEIKDALAFLRVINNPNDSVSLERIINVPPRGIGDKSFQKLVAWAEETSGGLWSVLEKLSHEETGPITGRARTALVEFSRTLMHLRTLQSEGKPPLEILETMLRDTGYLSYLQNDKTTEGQERLENVDELRQVASENAELTLGEFLENISLVADVDSLKPGQKAVTLMTLHAAKGLEFPVVFLSGLEEDTFPHWRAKDDPDQMAEERRLMYVGLTRAKDRVYLSYAFRRARFGQYEPSEPSRFIFDIPAEITEGMIFNAPPARVELQWQKSGLTMLPVQKKPRFSSGQHIVHNKYGEGIVIKSSIFGDMEEVEIDFPGHGKKRIDGDFLRLAE